ncbi:MAG TPA: pyridoxamine 5'-phosphate oxidase family protein [Chitinophagaceae bacterium]|nr:pyridoxamine 5'-phosphate oxidase family protein [Chitinophagaceae bacterium]
MDSINKNQQEQNHENLSNSAAAERIVEMVKEAKSCFFCTNESTGQSMGVRPMSIQRADEDGTLWFLSANDSHKNEEIEMDDEVRLFFQGSAHSDFLYLNGHASISEDRAIIKELWQPILKTWFTGGVDDPRISVIRFEPSEGYYWDNKHGNAVAGIKMLWGAIVGKTLDDSIEGKLRV